MAEPALAARPLSAASPLADAGRAARGRAGAPVGVVSPMLPARQYPPAGRRILRAARREAGAAPPVEALYGYESMRVVLEALRAAGGRATDRAGGDRGGARARAARVGDRPLPLRRPRRHVAAPARALRARARPARVPRPGARLGPLAVAGAQRERHPARGYALAAAAAAMWALNGSMARYLLDDGVGPFELSELRSLGSWLILLVVLGADAAGPPAGRARRAARRSRSSAIAGLAAVHASYFAAIERLEIGPGGDDPVPRAAAPARLAARRAPPPDRRAGSGAPSLLSAAGCFLVVRAYDAGDLDGLGVRGGVRRRRLVRDLHGRVGARRAPPRAGDDAVLGVRLRQPLLGGRRAVVELPVRRARLARGTSLLAAGRHRGRHAAARSSAWSRRSGTSRRPRAGVVATLEPVLAAVFAWIIHDEALAAVQVAGGMAVVAAVAWVQSRRPDLEAELAPVRG